MLNSKRKTKIVIMCSVFMALFLISSLPFLETTNSTSNSNPIEPPNTASRSEICRPYKNIQLQWDRRGYENIDEDVTYPNGGDGVRNYNEGYSETKTDVYELTQTYGGQNPESLDSITIYAFCALWAGRGGYSLLKVSYQLCLNGEWTPFSNEKVVGSTFSLRWKVFTWDNLGISLYEPTTIKLRVKLVSRILATRYSGDVYLDTMYGKLGLEPLVFETLIGSSDRYFPNDQNAKLGFTIHTTDDYISNPQLYFQFQETENDDNTRNVNIKIDGVEVHNEDFNIAEDEYLSRCLTLNQLRTEGTHQIVIEIFDGSYGENPHYKLNFIKISRLEFEEVIIHNYYYYSPTKSIYYGSSKDDATVSISTRHQAENLYGQMEAGNTYKFHTPIIVTIDPDIAAHYIDQLIVMWRVLDPNGNYLDTSTYDTVNKIDVSPDGYYEMDDITFLYSAIYGWFAAMIPYGLGEWLKMLTDELADLIAGWDDPILEHKQGSNGYYLARYKDGRTVSFDDKYPYYSTNEMSMLIEWEVDWPNTLYGSYQIEISWCAYVFDKSDIYLYSQPLIEFSLEGTHYLNFEIIE